MHWLIRVAILTLAAGSLFAQAPLAPVCGNEGERACGIGDYGFQGNYFWESARCEKDLAEINGICMNVSRRTYPKTGGWLGWAAAQQTLHIGSGVPINRISWLSAHNGYSNHRQGFTNLVYRNHVLSLTDQLQIGVRHFELDPHTYDDLDPSGPVRLCHASSTTLCYVSGYSTRLFANALKEFDNWLAANPGEVIVIKLDEKVPSGRFGRMYAEIAAALGPRIYQRQSIVGWPTVGQIRGAGKQVLIVQHNNTASSTPWVWDGNGAFLDNNWPKNQVLNFGACISSDLNTPLTRPIRYWWDIAEGRSGSNISFGGTFPNNYFESQTGLLYEFNVAEAVRCGVNIIGIDYLNSLGAAPPLLKREVPPDARPAHMIWSWATNDLGQNGPAMFRPRLRNILIFDSQYWHHFINGNRWHSRPSTELKPLACALRQGLGSAYREDRQWRITAQSYAWNKSVGDQACQAQFGADYEFAFPTNGFQNEELGRATTADVWISYSAVPQPDLSVTPAQFTFRRSPGAALPPAQSVHIAARAGAVISHVIPSASWARLSMPSVPYTVGGEGFDTDVRLEADAASLPPGTHEMTIEVRAVQNNITDIVKVRVNLVNIGSATVTVDVGATTFAKGTTVTGKIHVTSQIPNTTATGGAKLYRDAGTNNETTLAGGGLTSGILPFSLTGLAVGEYFVTGVFPGDSLHESAASAQVKFTVVPRIQSQPAALKFTMNKGGSLPAQQQVALSGLSNLPKLEQSCSWLNTVLNGSVGTIGVNTSANGLAVGQYACDVHVTDALDPNVPGGATIPVTLVVNATLASDPDGANLVAAKQPQGAVFSITASEGLSVPIAAASNQPWLSAVLDNTKTPAKLTVLADPSSLSLGDHGAVVAITSPLAGTRNIAINLKVVAPIIITTSPVGLEITVNGKKSTAPVELVAAPRTTISLGTNALQGSGDIRYRFTDWNGIATAALDVQAPANGGTFTATFASEYKVTAQAVPSVGGTIAITPASSDGFYAQNANVTVQATNATGFKFTGFTGGLSGAANPQKLLVTGPLGIVGAFAADSSPNLYASTGAARTDGPAAGQRTVPIVIRNAGAGGATNVQIVSITGIATVAGSGAVTLASNLPQATGTIPPNQETGLNLIFNWPATATRVRFTVNLSSNDGAYTGSTTLTLFR